MLIRWDSHSHSVLWSQKFKPGQWWQASDRFLPLDVLEMSSSWKTRELEILPQGFAGRAPWSGHLWGGGRVTSQGDGIHGGRWQVRKGGVIHQWGVAYPWEGGNILTSGGGGVTTSRVGGEQPKGLDWTTICSNTTFSKAARPDFLGQKLPIDHWMNVLQTPRDKLQCVLRCSSTIMNLLSMANERSVPAADDFMPVLIFVLIKANPISLLSTVQYVNSFYDKRLAGEEQYWWMQFCSAVEFIKTMD